MSTNVKLLISILVCIALAGSVTVFAQLAPEEVQPTEFQNRTTRSYIYQAEGTHTAPEELHVPFLYSVTETSPSVQSAFIQITGIAYPAVGTSTPGATISIDDETFSTTRAEFFRTNTRPQGRSFTLLYDVSPYFAQRVTEPGDYTFVWDALLQNVEYGSLAVELITTYQYEPIDPLMPIWGTLDSGVFDTGTPVGAGYNALSWRGALGGPSFDQGRVLLQLATSHCANGAGNAPACDDGAAWEFRGGALCSADDWFEKPANTPIDLHATGCLPHFNDKRYYRYRVKICSVECDTAGLFTPTVDEVIVNWSP